MTLPITALRMSPSGEPVVNEDGGQFIPGSGMVMRAAFESSAITSSFSISGSAAFEIKEDPGTTLAPFTRPELASAMQLGATYQLACHLSVFAGDAWSTNTVHTYLEGSTDDGSTWFPMGQNDMSIGGASLDNNRSTVEIACKSPPIKGSDITGLVEGGSLLCRASFSSDGIDNAISFQGNGSAPSFYLELTEAL